MKKLINADLIEILRLIPEYLPVPAESIDLDIQKLERMEESDYLFLARREKSWLFDLPRVYTPGTYENLSWTSGLELPRFPVVAMLLHAIKGQPIGNVTLLNYWTVAKDIEAFSSTSKIKRNQHIKYFLKYCTKASYCSLQEVIEFMRMGGETEWTQAEKWLI